MLVCEDKVVILISGKKRSGKNHTATLLKSWLETFNVKSEELSFAFRLKEAIAVAFGITIEEVNKLKDDETIICSLDGLNDDAIIDDEFKVSTDFREILQRYGMYMRKVYGDDFWVEQCYNDMVNSKEKVIIVTDWRFKTELRYLSNKIRVIDLRVDNKNLEDNDTHASEIDLDDWDFSFRLDNSDFERTQFESRFSDILKEI